jgi:precorrin-6B methylase 2
MELEKELQTEKAIDPSRIMQTGIAFWPSKILLTAVNMGVFTYLSDGPKSVDAIKNHFGLHDRGLYDFLDTLVALGFLKREGIRDSSIYSNAEDADLFLDKRKPTYIGGILEMANNRLYKFWGNLEEALITGKPQNELQENGDSFFEVLYSDQKRLREFINAMAGAQMGNFIAFAHGFDFSSYSTLCDMGGAGGFLAAQVAMNNPHIRAISFDLPQVEPIAKENIANMGLSDRVSIVTGDFFTEDFPQADIITMGNILHDWSLEEKKMLIKKAYDALPYDGAFVAIENIIDENRSQNAFGLMMSINMLIETEAGFDYSVDEFEEWAKEAGFRRVDIMPLAGSASAAIAYK